MLLNLFPPVKSLKNLIINTLLNDSSLNTMAIKRNIQKNYGVSATYQGINKILNNLLSEKILVKEVDNWNLSPQWVNDVKNTFSSLLKSHTPTFNPNLKSLTFKTISEALEFIRKNVENDQLRNHGEKFFLMHVKNLAFFKLSNSQDKFLKNLIKDTTCYILVEKNNLINQLVGRYLSSLGCKVYYNIPHNNPHTTTIYGNTMYYTYLNDKLNLLFDQAYPKIKKIIDLKALKIFDSLKNNSDYSVKFVFETDLQIVNQNKNYLLNLIKKNKSN